MRGIRDEEREKQQQEPSCKSRKLHLSDPLSDTSSIVSFDESSQPISTATSVESTFLSSHSSDSITPSSSMALPCDPIASTSSDTTLNTPLCCGSTTPSLGTSDTPRECNRCPKITRKIKALQRRYNRLQKHYAKLEERLKTIQNEQVSVIIKIVYFFKVYNNNNYVLLWSGEIMKYIMMTFPVKITPFSCCTCLLQY